MDLIVFQPSCIVRNNAVPIATEGIIHGHEVFMGSHTPFIHTLQIIPQNY